MWWKCQVIPQFFFEYLYLRLPYLISGNYLIEGDLTNFIKMGLIVFAHKFYDKNVEKKSCKFKNYPEPNFRHLRQLRKHYNFLLHFRK